MYSIFVLFSYCKYTVLLSSFSVSFFGTFSVCFSYGMTMQKTYKNKTAQILHKNFSDFFYREYQDKHLILNTTWSRQYVVPSVPLVELQYIKKLVHDTAYIYSILCINYFSNSA